MTNIAKYQLIRDFNCRFYNPTYYKTATRSLMLLDQATNRQIKGTYFEDVLEFGARSEVVKLTGLSVADLMQLDLPSYERLREVMLKEMEAKIKLTDKSTKEFEKRQEQLSRR